LAKGGYIIRIRPTAMGMEVEPTERDSETSDILGQIWPLPTPMVIARKIHTVRYRSSRDNRPRPVVVDSMCAGVSTRFIDQ